MLSILLAFFIRLLSPFDWYIHIRDIVKKELDKNLVFLLADELDEGLSFKRFTETISSQASLRKCIVEILSDYNDG